ncbi:MAG: 4Fe-4S binding protein [Desulfatiglans sp.]|nr:4Fe-4S binding protein [Thermodesulfobacteriota bacterium]MEE4353073.1 4Fe-4S binding protein [Desulfatiglans sp.]
MENKKKGPPISVDESNCAGCLICQLRCSLRFEKEFNPSRAAIKIRRLVGAENEYEITFTEKCDNCGICARFCPYGALVQQKKAA